MKLERTQDELVLDLDLEAIKWNADLKAFNYANCLTSLRSIFESDPEVRDIVRWVTLKHWYISYPRNDSYSDLCKAIHAIAVFTERFREPSSGWR